MPTAEPEPRTEEPLEDVEAELAAALPETQGRRFFPMLRNLTWHLVAALLLGAAVFVLWREFHQIRPEQLFAAIGAWGWGLVALALLLSTISFLFMGVVEWMGLRWAGAKIAFPVVMHGGFIACAMAHSLGANMLVSGAVRARLYARHGVTLRQVAATTVFSSFSFTVGLGTIAGISLLVAPSSGIAAASRIANPVADGLGVLLLGGVMGYVVACSLMRRPVHAFGHSLKLPSGRVAATQMVIGAVDNAVAAAIIWILLPHGSVDYFTFVGGYAPSVVAGLISHVPGGVGVFEGSLSTLLKGLEPAALAAAFLGYRLFFFVIPLLVAGLMLAADTLRERSRQKI